MDFMGELHFHSKIFLTFCKPHKSQWRERERNRKRGKNEAKIVEEEKDEKRLDIRVSGVK